MLNLCKRAKRGSENAQLSVEHQMITGNDTEKLKTGNELSDMKSFATRTIGC